MENFITDYGHSMTMADEQENDIYIPRYGVWVYDQGKLKMQVAEVSDDLEYLKDKYSVTSKRVVLKGGK